MSIEPDREWKKAGHPAIVFGFGAGVKFFQKLKTKPDLKFSTLALIFQKNWDFFGFEADSDRKICL